ncbi:hypothetical protein [Pantoea sp. ACRSC]|uniref:gp53-like domain-containing protein n=1 Tax=Pantoea sp. ACRSC TaxID=2918209 RepID=UPI001EF4CEA7|nr:hypothetical protein [Pantoea sp. ACRSC]
MADFAMWNGFIKNLGLGEAAKKNVGNGAGQLPDMSFFAAVKSGTGYCKLPSGIIFQWGYGSFAQQATTVVTLPIAFPNTGFSVVANKGSSVPLTGEYAVCVQFRDKTSFYLSNTGPEVTQQGIWWLAVGF